MGWRVAAAVVAGGLVLGVGPPASALEDAIVSGDEVEAEEGDDGAWTAEVEVTNLGDDDLVLEVDAPGGCDVEVDPEELAAGLRRVVTLTIAEDCVEDGEIPDLALGADGRGEPVPLAVAAAEPDEPVDYTPLWWYLAGAGLAAVVTFVTAVGRIREPVRVPADEAERAELVAELEKRDRRLADAVRHAEPGVHWPRSRRRWIGGLLKPLPHIAADWKFSDSWASNVGLAAALFTGVLGATEVLESVLGEESDGVQVTVVSALVTAALVAAAPLVLAIGRRLGPGGLRHNTVLGLLVGMLVVLAANLGQIAVIASLLHDATEVSEWLIWGTAGVAGALLGLYAIRNARGTLEDGLSSIPPEPPAPPAPIPTEQVEVATALGFGILRSADLVEAARMFAPLAYPVVTAELATSTGDDEPPRRAAMI